MNAANPFRRIIMLSAKRTDTRIALTSIRFASFLLVLGLVTNQDSSAQEYAEFGAEELFYTLADDSVDEATNRVMEHYGEAVAFEIAVYHCSPEPDPSCEGSEVYATWYQFIDRIYDDRSVAEVTQNMVQDGLNESLVTAIAVFWCSPEAGDGCGDDRYNRAWEYFIDEVGNDSDLASAISEIHSVHPFVAELIGVTVCGDATCYAEEAAYEAYYEPEPQAKEEPWDVSSSGWNSSGWQMKKPKRKKDRTRNN
jgi:hypothetical protein